MTGIIIYIYKKCNAKSRILIEKIIKKIDGQEFNSKLLRRIYKEIYKVDIGIGTYGCFQQDRYKHIKKIGNYSSIAAGMDFFSRNHPLNYASTHPYFYNSSLKLIPKDKIEFSTLQIGHDVWIGKDVKITNKCKYIGNGAVIGAGTVVTKNVEPYQIIAGNPGRVIRKRFDDETINLLEKSKWYLISPEELIKFEEFVDKPLEFAKKIIEYKKECNNEK